MEQLQHYRSMYENYLRNNISEVEKMRLMDFLDKASDQDIEFVVGKLTDVGPVSDLSDYELRTKEIFERISLHTKPGKTKLRKWIAAAAALLLVAGISLVIFLQKKEAQTLQQNVKIIKDVAPGGKRAILTLANGKIIALDSAGMGQLAIAGGAEINKAADGKIIYLDNATESQAVQQNTISVPRGGEYQLQLPDGTKVWLNAATKVTYPTRFEGTERRIKLDGEAYFEVAKDAKHPFIVETAAQQVKVLGTHFNVNTYIKNRTVTTLEEGSVNVSSLQGTKQSQTIVPGQQAVLKNGNIQVMAADLQSALAWKNGLIYFDSVPFDELLDEISRWYDIEIEFKGRPVDEQFVGGVYRSSNLSTILLMLKSAGLKTKLVMQGNNKKLIVEN